jgi:hypothetical protein
MAKRGGQPDEEKEISGLPDITCDLYGWFFCAVSFFCERVEGCHLCGDEDDR